MNHKSLKANIILNVVRQFFNMLMPFLTVPYISRILTENDYGRISFSRTWVQYFMLAASLGIADYAVREGARIRNDRKGIEKFVSEIFSINFLAMILSYSVLCLTLFLDIFNPYRTFIVVFSSTIFFQILGMEWICSVYEDFSFITVRTIVIRLLSITLLFCFVRSRQDAITYALILAVTANIEFFWNKIYIKKYVKVRLTACLNIRYHIKPILFLFGNTVIQTIYVNSDITILGIISGDKSVGIYTIAVNAYAIIKSVINAFSSVVLARVSVILEGGDFALYRKILEITFNGMFAVIFPVLVGGYMISGEIIGFLGGEKYVNSVGCLHQLCIALLFSTLGAFINMEILIPNRKEDKVMAGSMVSAAVNVVLNFLLIPHYSYLGAAFTTVVAEMVVFFVSYFFSLKVVKIIVIWKDIMAVLVGGVFIVLTCVSVDRMAENTLAALGLKIILSVMAYAIASLLMKHSTIKLLLQDKNRRKQDEK